MDGGCLPLGVSYLKCSGKNDDCVWDPNACGIPRVNGATGEPLEGPVWVDDTNTQFLFPTGQSPPGVNRFDRNFGPPCLGEGILRLICLGTTHSRILDIAGGIIAFRIAEDGAIALP